MPQVYRPHRIPAAADIEVALPSGRIRGRLQDFNDNGARLIGLPRLVRGTKLTLIIAQDRIEAVARWSAQDRCGVSFETPLPQHLVTRLQGKTPSHRAPRWSPPSGLREMR